jgi:Zn-dependent M28 family amino/carboxypeptidase
MRAAGLAGCARRIALAGLAIGWGAAQGCRGMPAHERPQGEGEGEGEAARGTAAAAPSSVRDRLARHVTVLAGEIGERNLAHPEALERAARHVEAEWAALGLEVERQVFEVAGRPVRNLAVELPGTSARDELVVVGAHYDSALGTPGADDNATGVAVLLELTRVLVDAPRARTIRLVAFVNEEAPYFATDAMGSERHARRSRERGERIVAMLSLEMLGYFRAEAGTQELPAVLRGRYPDRGDFLAFVSDPASAELCRSVAERFRAASSVPAEWFAGPTWIEGVSLSDHRSYWEAGYRAVMVTDTAFLRNPHYHQPSDTPATIDPAALAAIVPGLAAAVGHLATASARWEPVQ